jgi:hypothetical protein
LSQWDGNLDYQHARRCRHIGLFHAMVLAVMVFQAFSALEYIFSRIQEAIEDINGQ